jgi:serine/threonine protein kinase
MVALYSNCLMQSAKKYNHIHHWGLGQILKQGKYQIKDTISIGGFGITYLAINEVGQDIAIKTLNNRQQKLPNFKDLQEKFLNEALRIARCRHPQIVEVYEVFEEQGLWHIVMEYIDGMNLADYLETYGVMPEAQALQLTYQLAEVLSFMHELGFTHRDVKPDNIMLRRDTLEPVLVDFGLARSFHHQQIKTNTCRGSECFAPLEQDRTYQAKTKLIPCSDIYSLAATLYVMLTLQLPYPARIRYDGSLPIIPPQHHNPQISDSVNNAILKGMELFPENRPQSVDEWLELLCSPELPTDYLLSAKSIDYRGLQHLLRTQQWRKADQETRRLMSVIAGREDPGWLRTNDIDHFPETDLCTINQLWTSYSNGRFGFSVQKKIWQEVSGSFNYDTECRLGDRVGWREQGKWRLYCDLNFSLDAPVGHLPIGCGWFDQSNHLWCPSFVLLSRPCLS